MTTPLSRIKAQKAAEIAGRLPLDKDVLDLLQEDHTPDQYLKKLLDARRFAEAVQFLAHALPPVDMVWWATLCVGLAAGSRLGFVEGVILRKVAGWVRHPDEPHRRAIAGPAQGIPESHPASFVARAALRGIPGPQGPGTADLAAQAILRASPDVTDQRLCEFLALGIGIAKGKHGIV